MSKEKIKGTSEAWESGELGRDERYVRVSDVKPGDLDDALSLQMISIRLQKELLEDLKFLARYHGMGYQPLMKQALRRFADAEMKRIAKEQTIGEVHDEDDDSGPTTPRRRA